MNVNLEPQSNPENEPDGPGNGESSMKSEFLKKIRKMNEAKGTGPSKPKTPDYLSAKAEYRKQDGTVYRTEWEFGGAGRCDCPGYKFRHTCKHVDGLRNGAGLENDSDAVA